MKEASFKIVRRLASNLPDGDETDDHLTILYNFIILFGIIIFGFFGILIIFIPGLLLLLVDYIYTKTVSMKIDNISKTKVRSVINNYYNQIIPANKYYYLKGYKPYDNLSLEDFIYRFIKVYNDMYCTYEVGDNYYICDTSRRRSAHDIYLICKNYYKDITIDEVLTILVNLRNNNEIKGSYCNTIHRYVYHNTSNHRDDNDQTEYQNGIKFKDLINAYKE